MFTGRVAKKTESGLEVPHTLSSWYIHLVRLGSLLQVLVYMRSSGGRSFFVAELSIDRMLKHTACTDRAGVQSSDKIERQM